MRCPKCEHDMQSVEFEGVEVDRCRKCSGIWFDIGESELLRDREAAAAIDTGDRLEGREMNTISRYRCPRCNGGMMHTVDPRRPDIGYEECTSCRGAFFDSGEFADLARDSSSVVSKTRAQHKRRAEPE